MRQAGDGLTAVPPGTEVTCSDHAARGTAVCEHGAIASTLTVRGALLNFADQGPGRGMAFAIETGAER